MEPYVLELDDDQWTESAENEPDEWPDEPGDEQCLTIFEQVEQAPLVKSQPKSVVCDYWQV